MSAPEITVDRWIDEEAADGLEMSIGGLGGWFGFKESHTFDQYLDAWEPEVHAYIWAMKREVVRLGLREGGDWHQSAEGTPVFSDGTIGAFSFRGWGDLLAAIWTAEDGVRYSYMDFYMSPGTDKETARTRGDW